MSLNRRAFLSLTAAALALPRAGFAAVHASDEGWITTAGTADGFGAFALSDGLDADQKAASAQRLHGIEASPRGPLAVAVGRRPGRIALVFDVASGAPAGTFAPGAGRVFSGHGRFSSDGTIFLTNEIEPPLTTADGHVSAMGRGIVAVRSVAGAFEIVDEWPTLGDGPHDLMRSGGVLVVANGGIEPHSQEARDAEVSGSSITLLHPQRGEAVGEGRLSADLASLSLRHLACDGKGGTVVAAQDLLSDGIARPLLFSIAPSGAITPFDAPEAEWRALRGYVGSVAYDASGAFVACATPRGNRVAVWRADGAYVGAVPLMDGCGLAGTSEPGRFVATSGYGEVMLISAGRDGVGVIGRRTGGPRFDNHVARLTLGD